MGDSNTVFFLDFTSGMWFNKELNENCALAWPEDHFCFGGDDQQILKFQMGSSEKLNRYKRP